MGMEEAQLLVELKEQMKSVSEDVRTIKSIMTGNGDPSKGFIVRLDRLEQDKRFWDKVINACIAAAIALGFSYWKPK